ELVASDLVVLNLEKVGLSDDQFFDDNRDFQFELTAQKELWIMTPPGGKTGRRNLLISFELENWARTDSRGITFNAALFHLPNGSIRAPDGSWVRRDKWDSLSDEQQERSLRSVPISSWN